MEPSWHVVTAGLGPLAPFSLALERAFAYERMRRSLWVFPLTRIRGMPLRGIRSLWSWHSLMALSGPLAMRDAAHSKVVVAETVLNRHIRECDTCKRDGRTPVNMTVGQF
jgi:hypothetical protein